MDENTKEEQSISTNDLDYLPVTKNIRESLRVQRTEYIRQQLRRRREQEDAVLARLLEEQRIIEGLQKQIDENLEQTEEGRKYNQEFKENMNEQVYALHGISSDKLEGMRAYKNAYYQGCAFSLFFLSAALIILCGMLHGFQSDICIFMLAYTGLEGALLTQEKKRWKAAGWLCRLLYLLIFPAMMVMFVCYELKYSEYDLFLPYVVLAGTGILIFAVISYFLYNPYRDAKKRMRAAKGQIAEIEKTAKKEVRKNKRTRRKEEKRAFGRQKKEDRRLQRGMRRSEKKDARRKSLRRIREKIAAMLHGAGSGNRKAHTKENRKDEPGRKKGPQETKEPGGNAGTRDLKIPKFLEESSKRPRAASDKK